MRIFMLQSNLIETEPAIDSVTKEPVEDLTINVSLFDPSDTLIPSSNISLTHINGGIYRGTMPELGALVNKQRIKIEVEVLDGPTRIWYFKGEITSIIRNQL